MRVGIFLFFFFPTAFGLNCLVIRPGYGLVSEKCPKGSTGCRIRISKDSVDFYEYSALYDRNQYVCVHKTEFDGAMKSGCIRKKSGKIRCWCHGRTNCNTPEDSKALYEAFASDSIADFNQIIEQIDSSPPNEDYSDAHSEKKTTTKTPEIVKVPIVSKFKSSEKKLNPTKATEKDKKGKDLYFVAKSETEKSDDQKHKLRKHHHHHHKSDEKQNQITQSTKNLNDYSNQIKSQDEKYNNQRKSKNENYNVQMKAKVQDYNNKQKSSGSADDSERTAKIHLDDNNEIHVIHIKPEEKSKYERIVASDEFGKIVQKATPTEPTSDDLYDEDELARLDAEYIERKKQNRPKPMEPEIVRVLPQEDLDVELDLARDPNKDLESVTGEYFDAVPVDFSSTVSFSISLIISVLILFLF